MINNFLHELADYLGLTHPVTEISQKTGLSTATVSRYYSNKLKISRNFIKKLNEVYNIDYNNFVKTLRNQVNEPPATYMRPDTKDETKRLIDNFYEAIENAKSQISALKNKENTPENAKLILEWKKFIFEVKKDIEIYKKFL